MKSTDVVAYTYNAEILCPDCTVEALPTSEGQPFDGWALGDGVTMPVEDNLGELAQAFGINRRDESTFDSADFPKVVFLDQLNDKHEVCANCGKELLS